MASAPPYESSLPPAYPAVMSYGLPGGTNLLPEQPLNSSMNPPAYASQQQIPTYQITLTVNGAAYHPQTQAVTMALQSPSCVIQQHPSLESALNTQAQIFTAARQGMELWGLSQMIFFPCVVCLVLNPPFAFIAIFLAGKCRQKHHSLYFDVSDFLASFFTAFCVSFFVCSKFSDR
jgi:hypothetical protein